MFAKKWEWPWNVTNADCKSNKGTVRKKLRTFYVLAAFCYNLKFIYRFLKITNMISIKVLISIEIARFIPKCTWCFVDLAFTFFSCMLNTLIFTVDGYILKNKTKTINVLLGLSQLQSSILLINTISIYHIVKCLSSYYIFILYSNFVRNYFVC